MNQGWFMSSPIDRPIPGASKTALARLAESPGSTQSVHHGWVPPKSDGIRWKLYKHPILRSLTADLPFGKR